MIETYLFLFFDSFSSSIILPIRSEMVFDAMIAFNNYNIYLVFLIAFCASILGLLINYVIGKLLTLLKKTEIFKGDQNNLLKIQNFWNKYLIWFLPIMAFYSLGAIFCLFCGFFNSKLRYLIPLIALGRFAYYFTQIIG